MYLQYRPGGPLAPYVETLWYCEGYPAAHRRERVLPNGRFQILIDLATPSGPRIVEGMRTTYTILETASIHSIIGVVFRPGGALPFFRVPAEEFQERLVPLDDVWGSAGGRLRDRLLEAREPAMKLGILEANLRQRLSEPPGMHGAVRYALGEFARDARAARIHEVADYAGLSRRRFAQLFREQVGLTPKLYCRLRRFHDVVRRVASGATVDWAEVAVEGGYYDQAHMAHEFREFAGVSPGAWQASERPFLNHGVVD